MLTPLPNVWELEAGSATLPFFGIQTQLCDKSTQKALEPPAQGELCIRDSWPGQARTLYGNHARFIDVYFKPYPGYYFSGDGCEIKENGYHWITGRVVRKDFFFVLSHTKKNFLFFLSRMMFLSYQDIILVPLKSNQLLYNMLVYPKQLSLVILIQQKIKECTALLH